MGTASTRPGMDGELPMRTWISVGLELRQWCLTSLYMTAAKGRLHCLYVRSHYAISLCDRLPICEFCICIAYLDFGGLLSYTLPNCFTPFTTEQRDTSWIAVHKVRCERPKSAAFHPESSQLLVRLLELPNLVVWEIRMGQRPPYYSQSVDRMAVRSSVTTMCIAGTSGSSLTSQMHLSRSQWGDRIP